MFSKVKNASRDVIAADAKSAPPSIISSDMRVTGDIVSDGEVQIDGAVEGDVRCDSLTVGVTGSIKGEVEVNKARVHGAMTGQLRAASVFLASTARMTGDVTHESLAVEPGAFVDGHCHHMEPKSADEKTNNLMLADDTAQPAIGNNNKKPKGDRTPQQAIKDALPEKAAKAS